MGGLKAGRKKEEKYGRSRGGAGLERGQQGTLGKWRIRWEKGGKVSCREKSM